MANPCFGGGMEGYWLVDGVEAGAHVFEGVVEARRQPLYEFQTSGRHTGNNPNAGACHFVVHEKRRFRQQLRNACQIGERIR
jgi:hypothetical protein